MPKYNRQNRINKRSARQGSGICYGCDRCWVRPGSKCSICGTLMGKKRDKKPSPNYKE